MQLMAQADRHDSCFHMNYKNQISFNASLSLIIIPKKSNTTCFLAMKVIKVDLIRQLYYSELCLNLGFIGKNSVHVF